MTRKALSDEERETALKALPAWTFQPERNAIRRELKFSDFNQAFAFMARVAMFAEKTDHHPEWSNVYNRVEIVLTTHDVGGVSALDIEMASFIDGVAPG